MSYPATIAQSHPDYDASILLLEEEMDYIWPEWDAVVSRTEGIKAKGTPFNQLPYPKLSRMKWLAKRRLQLLKDMGDWGILVAQDRQDPRKCYAHPVPPHADGRPSRPEPPPTVFKPDTQPTP